jgi:hypothetical protein
MATFNIEEGSIRSEGGKTFMTVTFKAADGRSSTEHYEVESEEAHAVQCTLQNAADEFERRWFGVKPPIVLVTGKDIEYREQDFMPGLLNPDNMPPLVQVDEVVA